MSAPEQKFPPPPSHDHGLDVRPRLRSRRRPPPARATSPPDIAFRRSGRSSTMRRQGRLDNEAEIGHRGTPDADFTRFWRKCRLGSNGPSALTCPCKHSEIVSPMTDAYPRDMIGYGRTPPFADWPERRAGRAAVRHQLRRGRREQHPARRRRLRGLPVRDRRRRALAGHAPHEHGIDLRIRLARRLLAAAPHVHRARHARHRLCGGDGDGAQSAGGRRR